MFTDGDLIVSKDNPEWGVYLVKGEGFGLVIISESGNKSHFDPKNEKYWEKIND